MYYQCNELQLFIMKYIILIILCATAHVQQLMYYQCNKLQLLIMKYIIFITYVHALLI